MRRRPALRPPALYAPMLRRWSRVSRWPLDNPAALDFCNWLAGTIEGRAWGCYARTVRALFSNRHHRRSDNAQACIALSTLHRSARDIHHWLAEGDHELAESAAAPGDSALKDLYILALLPAAKRGLPFMHDQLNAMRVAKLAKRLKARGCSREQVRYDPALSVLLAELGIENVEHHTLEGWIARVYGTRPPGRPKGSR